MQYQLFQSIKQIRSDGKPVDYLELSMENSSHMYSSTKEPKWRLLIDGVHLSRKEKYDIVYSCLTCGEINEVSCLRFYRKLNSRSLLYCKHCRNTSEKKRLEHSKYMTGKNIRNLPPKETPCVMTKKELFENGLKKFENMDDAFQENYMQKHLSDTDMERIFKHLVSLRNGKVSKQTLERCTYWWIFPCQNQMKFTSVFYDSILDEVIKLDQPILKCEQCHCEWRAKNLHKMKNDRRILCKDCKLCRRTYKIQGYDTLQGVRVTFQSRQEKQFIDWCDDQGIVVENGPNIPYVFDNIERTYKVDFAIPSLGFLVEIKDNHIWHKQQVASGQWDAKVQGVSKFLQTNPSFRKFVMITPQTKTNVYQEILAKLNKI